MVLPYSDNTYTFLEAAEQGLILNDAKLGKKIQGTY